MALADYFDRNATAAAQVLSRYDDGLFREMLCEAGVGIGFGEAARSPEGRALLELVVRLLARLYPSVTIGTGNHADHVAADLADLARSINPRIEVREGDARVLIAVGEDVRVRAPVVVHAGSDAWDAILSTTAPQRVGSTDNPFGAGAAACFACANAFRAIFLDDGEHALDGDLRFSVLDRNRGPSRENLRLEPLHLQGDAVLVGLGAIGNSAAWALSRVRATGTIHLVDPEGIELSNLQRYALATRDDEARRKVDVAAGFVSGGLEVESHGLPWAQFVEERGYAWRRVLVALDSARDRRAVQAALPGWIANAWTQPGDLGLSTHVFGADGACLSCLYLPGGERPSDDAIIARALGVTDRLMQIRQLLYHHAGAPRDLLELIAARLQVPLDRVLAFEGRPLRSLYVEGICSGGVIPLGRSGVPWQEVHVPLAHQSALAGILLAGAFVSDLIGVSPATTMVTRVDLLRPLGEHLSQPARKDPRGMCICQDADYIDAYRRKYSR